ncbi:MFS transporter [Shimazuella sp. AN120528]|uniref:MFS transporter n=1 Tax=Shimazuella soli TaxID=1892854 RepID=UPI001F10A9B2|nr:MFS transporter [Shimazuella soli]MCH5585757.1 MFS transporter [Shimazuella soli]
MEKLRGTSLISLIILACCTFCIGMTEFVIMGLLPNVAQDLHVSISDAGLLVTGYALGVALVSPIISMLTTRLPVKLQLCLLMAIFVCGNALAAFAPNYEVLMAARIVASITHGAFLGLGIVVASKLVPEGKQGSAVSLMFAGGTFANVLGVPFGTFWGQEFGWRSTFEVIAILGCVCLVALMLFVPRIQHLAPLKLRTEVKVLFRPNVILALLTTLFSFGGVLTTFTYIAPLVERYAHATPSNVSWIFLIFGVGMTLGAILGGRLANVGLRQATLGSVIFLAVTLFVTYFSDKNTFASFFTVFLLGAACGGSISCLQLNVLDKAKDAPNLSSTLNIGAFNLSNACGALIGSLVIKSTLGLGDVPLVSTLVTIVGIALIFYQNILESRKSNT